MPELRLRCSVTFGRSGSTGAAACDPILTGSRSPGFLAIDTADTVSACPGRRRCAGPPPSHRSPPSSAVSRTTVSNAYNRPDQLSAPLRARVLEAARRLGYPGPDPVARSLRTRKAGAVGLLLTEALSYAFRDPVATGFLEGLALACEERARACCSCP